MPPSCVEAPAPVPAPPLPPGRPRSQLDAVPPLAKVPAVALPRAPPLAAKSGVVHAVPEVFQQVFPPAPAAPGLVPEPAPPPPPPTISTSIRVGSAELQVGVV